MTKFWINLVLVRILFPSLLVLGVVWRPVGLSLPYLLLALITPFVPVPTYATTNGQAAKPVQRFLIASIILSFLIVLTQLAFQIFLLVLPPYAHFLKNCEFLEKLFRHIGLVKLDNATIWECVVWLTPEIVILPSSIVTYCISRGLTKRPATEDDESPLQRHEQKSKDRSDKIINFLGGFGTYIVLATLCFTASLNPSFEGGFYFLVFISLATWWATYRELRRGFAVICRLLMIVVGLHITVLLAYQNQWPQEYLPSNGTWARYLALNATSDTNCSDPRNREYIKDNALPVYSYQLRLFLLYFVLGLQSRFMFTRQSSAEANQRTCLSGKLETLDTPLSRHVSIRKRTPSQRWQSARRKARKQKITSSKVYPNERTPLMRFGSGRTGLLQDSTGSVIVQDVQQDDSIQMQLLSEGAPEEQPGILEHVIMAFFSIAQLIAHSSYLGTNILMMTWSIMYHSWSTFVLLLWALILWMVPNKRASMMKCSQFIVLYTTALILIQYVYALNLTEQELPTVIYGINMTDLGFNEPPGESSHWHLIIKCCFLTMFWITMRQYSSEKMRQRRSSTLRDMVAPLHVSMSTATTAMNNQAEPEIKSQYVQDVGKFVKKFLIKFWIATVALMLFISGILGERMTVFRIIYMTLFLLFVITFQISWDAWKKMLYGFLVTVIGYSVIMLILVYTYQFPYFPDYWEQYLYISKNLQRDIGLITYDTKDLFVKLITPTSFVIISVLQIHYFHKDFLETTNLSRVSDVERKDSLGHSPSTIPIVSPTEVFISENDDLSHVFTLKELKEMSKLEVIVLWKKFTSYFWNFYNYTWIFFELHIQKIIFISFVIFCINDICAINFFFVITVVISINFRRTAQIMVINMMATAIAVLMVLKMLYQIDYIKHDDWDRDCPNHTADNNSSNTTVYNMAEWIGLKKVDKSNSLSTLLEGSIWLLTVTTLRSMIMVRQLFYRQQNGMPLETPLFMFPEIKRVDADKGLLPCFKFLCNYGFYKFGLEFCLIGMVALIGTRLDFYSVLYSIWLMILFSLNRKTTSKVWPFLKLFSIVLLPLQYAMIVAPPPWLCINYPWQDSEILKRLQEWMLLPDPDNRPNPKKLMCDFILLVMLVRQSLVFRIEKRSSISNQEFVAGHNYSVYKEAEKPNFVNPVKDYVSHIHNWLDVFKRGCFMSLMWITLAFMFLAGTKRTNLFSLGYLIGVFVFLWQGSDFYLRPVNTIIKWWNMLIGYNILVIFSKIIFQGIGCIFIQNLEAYACWLIQLLGVACLNKFNKFDTYKATCEVDREDVGMFWDGLCFAFLIMQKRLFRSYYFFYIVDETKAMSILASRGAELLEELHEKRILEQENLEKAVLQKIKFKMDKIKANQQKIHGPNYREHKTHCVEGEAPLARASSMSSCISSTRTPPQGYQTPIDEDDDDEPPPLTPRAASLLQAPSPNSAVMTVSLEGYLDPGRISFSSPPNSELNPRGPSPDETFPVFSPPPYNTRQCEEESQVRRHRRQSSYAENSWTDATRAHRHSVISTASRSPRSYHTYTLYKPLERPMHMRRSPNTHAEAVRSGDYYMFDDMDDDDLTDIFLQDKDATEEESQRREAEKRGRQMTVSELMNTLIKTDIEIATHVALYGGTEQDAMKIRRRSMPLTRKKSSMSYLSARSDTDTAAATNLPEQETRTTDSTDDDATDREFDDLDKMSERGQKEKKKKKEEDEKDKVSFLTYFKFLWAFLNSTMVSMTRYLNRYSNDYRYIRKVLAKEKKLLKAKPDFRMGTRLGINQIWQPIVKPRSSRDANEDEIIEDPGEGPSCMDENYDKNRKQSSLSVPHIRILAPSMERGLDMSSSSSILARGIQTHNEEDEEAVLSELNQPPIIQLAASIWFGILAHSTFLCYFMVFFHQIQNASLLSTPLPLMVFLWGSLTIPRPSKTFWITLIAYVEVIVIIKCICQPAFLIFNKKDVAKILGVERKPNYALWDLMLLLVVFFHRYMLKSLGQWTTSQIKSRKVIPSGLTVATIRHTRAGGDTENIEENAINNEMITPKGRVLSLHLDGAGDRLPHPPPIGDNERLIVIQATERDVVQEDFKKAVKLTINKYLEPMKSFFDKILDPSGKEKTNVYAYMFLCDFINFILLIFGFSSFGAQQGDGGVATYFAENRVPMPFLLMLLLQFALIVIDRAFYLKKSVSNKLKFHYALVIGVHIWMFFILPSVTERSFNTRTIPQIWYMVKCFYLLLAAYQLRLGYPTRILGNFLCQHFTIVHFTLFKGFMVIPFLFELRAVMDWMWTDTSMTVMDWFKMEDIFANIYLIKCTRRMEDDYPQERGVKKKQLSKYLIGGGALFVMIGMIWFPLLIFALGSTVGKSNLPNEVKLNIKIGSYEPIYTIAAQNSSIIKYSEKNFNELKELYDVTHKDRAAATFLEDYVSTDVVAVKFSTESGRLWSISPPDLNRLKEELKSDDTMTVHVEWTITRRPASEKTSGMTTSVRDIPLPAYLSDGKINPARKDLLDALEGLGSVDRRNNSSSVLIGHALPMFLKVTSQGVSVVRQLMKPLLPSLNSPSYEVEASVEVDDYLYRDITLVLNNNSLHQQWFSVHENCSNEDFNKIPLNDCSYIMMYLFNDKIFPEGLSFISGLGIFGLYTTAVILLSSFIKRLVSDMVPTIMFEDLPYVDRILRLCLDIYLVRESGDLCLEEDLFAKLVFLFRSPETLIRWTRPPESDEQMDGNDDNENYNEIDNDGVNEYEDEHDRLQLRRRRED